MRSLLLRTTLAIGVGLLAIVMGRPAMAVSVVPMSLQDTIHEASAIFRGRVLQAQSHWGTLEKRWMVTDYLFKVDEAILPDGSVQTGGQVLLTWAGGTIGKERQAIMGLQMPKVGEQYLLMLRKDWAEPKMSPEVALNHGLFRVASASKNGPVEIREAEDQPLFQLTNGMIVRGWEVKGVQARRGVALADFTAWLRASLDRIKSSPISRPPVRDLNDPYALPTFSLPVERGPVVQGRLSVDPAQIAVPRSFEADGGKPPAPPKITSSRTSVTGPRGSIARSSKAGPLVAGNVAAGTSGQQAGTQGYRNAAYAFFKTWPASRLRMVFNPFPIDGSWAPWSPEDQYQMSKWNHYGDIIRVLAVPTGTWAWGNSRNDLCGWPDNETMIDQFGEGWGATTLAVCWSRWDGSGLLESDIAFNPAYGWTLNDEAVYNNSTTAWPFRSTMVHEMGHSWGLEHQFNFISGMNYQEKVFRMFGFPYTDDAEGIRWYAAYAQTRSNLANYMYRSAGYQDWADITKTSSVIAGNAIAVNDHHIENVGTVNLPDTPISWYLTPQRDWDVSYHLGDTSYGALPRYSYFNTWTVGRTFTVPASTPAGSYYLATYLWDYAEAPGQADFPFSNRHAWSRTTISVQPRIESVVVSPSISPRNSTATGTVYLYGKSDGRSVSLSSSNVGVATVPATVYVPAGATSASFTITIQPGSTSGSSVITATLLGYSVTDTAYASARTTLTGVSVSGMLAQTVTLSATLKNSITLAAIPAETIYFFVDGGYVGSGVTIATGKATYKFKIPDTMALGNHTIDAVHYTNYSYYQSTATNILTVKKANTKLTFTDQSVPVGKLVTVKATLKRSTDSAPLAGYNVSFYENRVFVGTFVTNATGVASYTRKFDEPYGLGPVAHEVRFAGTSLYNATTDLGTITINPSPTSITLKSASGVRGASVVLSAVLKRTSDSAYLNGRTLKFYVDGSFVGNGVMVANVAKVNYTIPTNMTIGKHVVKVDFLGEAFYLASTKSGTVLTVK